MNRREFIGGTIVGAVAAGLPATRCDCASFPGEVKVEIGGVDTTFHNFTDDMIWVPQGDWHIVPGSVEGV